ncbi:MAG: TPM domain-containing protein, partial [Clostridia bacterium]|nr:TPM domain-containing protein [Clostridia bacterium]
MKRTVSIVLCLVLLLPLALTAHAAADYNTEYRRFSDYASVTTEEEGNALNDRAWELVRELGVDMPVCLRQSSVTLSLSEIAKQFYENSLYGVGETKSGIFLLVDFGSSTADIFYFGEIGEKMPESEKTRLSDAFFADCKVESYSMYQIVSAYFDRMEEAVRKATGNEKLSTTFNDPDRTDGMPYWYFEGDLASFTDFHGTNLPRVIDDADIFTDEEEAQLDAMVKDVIDLYGIGYVLFTDRDNHGLSMEEYSSDFLHFNGYGVGDGYGAVVFYLSLEEGNRGWRTTSIKSYERIFNSGVTYQIDELVDSDIRGGDYYAAFVTHVKFVGDLFSRMSNDLPEWYPENTRTYELDRSDRDYAAEPDYSKTRIVDDAGLFGEEEERAANEKLAELSRQYGYDLVIFTDTAYHTPTCDQYVDDFYYFNGYSKDGLLLFILSDE